MLYQIWALSMKFSKNDIVMTLELHNHMSLLSKSQESVVIMDMLIFIATPVEFGQN